MLFVMLSEYMFRFFFCWRFRFAHLLTTLSAGLSFHLEDPLSFFAAAAVAAEGINLDEAHNVMCRRLSLLRYLAHAVSVGCSGSQHSIKLESDTRNNKFYLVERFPSLPSDYKLFVGMRSQPRALRGHGRRAVRRIRLTWAHTLALMHISLACSLAWMIPGEHGQLRYSSNTLITRTTRETSGKLKFMCNYLRLYSRYFSLLRRMAILCHCAAFNPWLAVDFMPF